MKRFVAYSRTPRYVLPIPERQSIRTRFGRQDNEQLFPSVCSVRLVLMGGSAVAAQHLAAVQHNTVVMADSNGGGDGGTDHMLADSNGGGDGGTDHMLADSNGGGDGGTDHMLADANGGGDGGGPTTPSRNTVVTTARGRASVPSFCVPVRYAPRPARTAPAGLAAA